MLEGFIFDMDGVIVNSEPVHYKLIKKTYEKYGKSFTHEDHKSITGMSYLDIWEKFVREHSLDIDKMIIHREHTKALLSEIENSKDVEISKGIIDLIHDLKKNNVKLAVASSSAPILINAVLERFGIRENFEVIVSGEELPKSKPHPDVFLKALEKLKISANKALVVEDSTNGIKAAKAAGIKCLAFLNENENTQNVELADIKFNSFEELNYKKLKNFL